MRFVTMTAACLAFAGCGGDPKAACEDYVAAYKTCATDAYGDQTTGAQTAIDAAYPDTFCDAYDGLSGDAKKAAVDLFDCYTEKLDAADCSTTDGLTAYSTSLGDCAAAGA